MRGLRDHASADREPRVDVRGRDAHGSAHRPVVEDDEGAGRPHPRLGTRPRGAGVVGETPTLEPGESFEYTSGVPLPTPSGFMTGTYGMVTAAGEEFDIEIPAFSLDTPQRARTIN